MATKKSNKIKIKKVKKRILKLKKKIKKIKKEKFNYEKHTGFSKPNWND